MPLKFKLYSVRMDKAHNCALTIIRLYKLFDKFRHLKIGSYFDFSSIKDDFLKQNIENYF